MPKNNNWYDITYQYSINQHEKFWSEMAKKFLTWDKPFESVDTSDFSKQKIEWFKGGKLNACFNCVDRHLIDKSNKVALIWEPDSPESPYEIITYRQLYQRILLCAHALQELSLKKGDVVCFYMPMVPESIIAMLACARLGIIHNVVFSGFSSQALYNRIRTSKAKVIITCFSGKRGDKILPLKKIVDDALSKGEHSVIYTLIFRGGIKENMRDVLFDELITENSLESPIVQMSATDPLFILYTSGSTGMPKGIVQSTGGYLLYAHMTFRYAFNYQDSDIFWCTADIGWITGHSYTVYGALAAGATTIIFEGSPFYPTYARYWEIIDKHHVSIFYTAPTILRSIKAYGDALLQSTSRRTLRVLGSVGEPINPDTWKWYYYQVGNGRCHISDTWWQTETGGHMILPLPGTKNLKPGSAMNPFFGIDPVLLDKYNQEIKGEGSGALFIKKSWPGQAINCWEDNKRFKETYFSVPGYYKTGDGAYRDKDSSYWITGRIDDVINVSGHRIGTAELEFAITSHESVEETAVVSIPHKIKGESICVYVRLKEKMRDKSNIKSSLIELCAKNIGSFAKPEIIYCINDFPKTRSGKIMRRILHKIAIHDINDIGDISTIANPEIVAHIIKVVKQNKQLL